MKSLTTKPALRIRSLAAAPVGRTMKVTQIIFEGLRAECARLGVQEGQVIRLESRTDARVVLASPDGVSTCLEPQWANFIEVELPSMA